MLTTAMNVLIVSTSFAREIHCLIDYVGRHHPRINIHAIMPRQTRGRQRSDAYSRYRLVWPHHIRGAWFWPPVLREFNTFRPDIVQIFEEYSSLMAFQAVLLRNLYCPQARIMAYAAENIPGNVHPLFQPAARYVLRHTDLAFVCSHGVKAVLADEGCAATIEVFPLGVDTDVFRKCDASALKHDLGLDGTRVIGYVGRLLTIKGIFDILDVLRHIPEDVHALLIGGGPEEENIRRRCLEVGLTDRVHLIGEVPYAELPRYMNCMDVGIVPSHTTPRWKEQFGRVLVELMSCEVPVLGSDSGSIPEVLGDVGLIFPERNLDVLAARVQELLNQPERRRDLGPRGRQRVKALYSLSVMYQQMLTMYERMSGEPLVPE